MSKLKEKLMLSEKGYSDLKKAITACTITNIALLLPSMVACLLFWELLKPFTGEAISWDALWKLLGLGVVAAILVFLAAKNDYRKTYIASYKEASTTRLRIAEHLRKLPMSFFNTKDLSDITTNMMADCSSMESMLSSTIPPLIANIISVTLTCICLAFFDWRKPCPVEQDNIKHFGSFVYFHVQKETGKHHIRWQVGVCCQKVRHVFTSNQLFSKKIPVYITIWL